MNDASLRISLFTVSDFFGVYVDLVFLYFLSSVGMGWWFGYLASLRIFLFFFLPFFFASFYCLCGQFGICWRCGVEARVSEWALTILTWNYIYVSEGAFLSLSVYHLSYDLPIVPMVDGMRIAINWHRNLICCEHRFHVVRSVNFFSVIIKSAYSGVR